jgi:hypothetical protein
MLPFLIGSPIFLDASLFKLKPPPHGDGGFLFVPVRNGVHPFFGRTAPLLRLIPP